MPCANVGRPGKDSRISVSAEREQALGGEPVVLEPPAAPDIESMFADRPAEEWRARYRDAFDWGPDVGREGVGD